jgi:uncharacterized lipoprotein NlpE involved in copper resistance
MKIRNIFAALAVTMTLVACTNTQKTVVPSASAQTASASSVSGQPLGTEPAAPVAGAAIQPLPYQPLDASKPGQPTGTMVGERVEQFRADLTRLQQATAEQIQRHQQLRADAEANAAAYQTTVGAINAKLQIGTTPGNPGVIEAYKRAQTQLQMVGADLDQMNVLSNNAANNAAFNAYLLDSIRASYSIYGAVEEDHRQLRILEDAATQTSVNIDRLLSALTEDVSRQNHFLGIERSNLTQMAMAVNNGEYYGTTLASQAIMPPATPASAPGTGLASGRPLVVIRFDRSDVKFEQALYQATSAALVRRPNAAFDLVAVSSAIGTPAQVALNSDIARTNADKVMRSLLNMGLPADRISTGQVTDPNIQNNEVHLYVR